MVINAQSSWTSLKRDGSLCLKQGMKNHIHMAMANWLTLGIQAGFRIREWAQEHKLLAQTNGFARSCDGSSTTFRTDDKRFVSTGKKMINTKQLLIQLKHTKLVNLRWRFQKT